MLNSENFNLFAFVSLPDNEFHTNDRIALKPVLNSVSEEDG